MCESILMLFNCCSCCSASYYFGSIKIVVTPTLFTRLLYFAVLAFGIIENNNNNIKTSIRRYLMFMCMFYAFHLSNTYNFTNILVYLHKWMVIYLCFFVFALNQNVLSESHFIKKKKKTTRKKRTFIFFLSIRCLIIILLLFCSNNYL